MAGKYGVTLNIIVAVSDYDAAIMVEYIASDNSNCQGNSGFWPDSRTEDLQQQPRHQTRWRLLCVLKEEKIS